MRTMIVRRALDELVNKKVSPSSKKSDKPFKRMTNTDRNRYQLAAIPEPPSRMNASYMEEVFAISEVSEFFCEFLKGKLKSYLKRANE